MSQQRLFNEYTTLKYIEKNTTIPVPKALRFEYIDKCFAITTELVAGVPFDELNPQIRSTSYLDDYVQTTVLPQLRVLRARVSGTIDGIVLPPRRILDKHPRRQWSPRMSDQYEYRFVHNDLSQHNFLCDEQTGRVTALIDWEYSGFYPAYFEAPLWRSIHTEVEDDPEDDRRLLDFLGPSTTHRRSRSAIVTQAWVAAAKIAKVFRGNRP